MLFKPHFEKKIFGISLPFTPGLIPKERERMAENIGDAVGIHLLSTDTIIEAISDKDNEKRIKAWINGKIEALRQDDIIVNEFLRLKIGEEYNLENEKLKEKISKYILSFIRSEKVKKALKIFIDENVQRYNTDNLYKDIELKTKIFINEFRESEELRHGIDKCICNLLDKV